MSVELFSQILVNGLMTGGTYAMVASGFTLILGVIKIFNFAQGQFYMLGAYVTYGVATGLGLPYYLGLIIALVAMGILGVIFHVAIVQWTIPSGFFNTLLVTVAFAAIVTQVSVLTFGFREAVMSPVVDGTLNIGGVSLSYNKLLVIGGAVIVMVGLNVFMKTKAGVAMRAAAENRDVAALQGINANRIFWMTMAVGCGLCGIAGALIVPVLGASSGMGNTIFIKVLLVVLVGGSGSMAGALLAAFVVGIVESFAFQFFGEFSLVAIFVFVAILLFFRPGGLLGKPLPIPGE